MQVAIARVAEHRDRQSYSERQSRPRLRSSPESRSWAPRYPRRACSDATVPAPRDRAPSLPQLVALGRCRGNRDLLGAQRPTDLRHALDISSYNGFVTTVLLQQQQRLGTARQATCRQSSTTLIVVPSMSYRVAGAECHCP